MIKKMYRGSLKKVQDGRFYYTNCRGSFERLSAEGVPTNLSRSIVDRRQRLEDEEGEEMPASEMEPRAAVDMSGGERPRRRA